MYKFYRQCRGCKIIIVWIFLLCGSLTANENVVGYYPWWMHNDLPAVQIPYQHLTHIVHAFAWPGADGSLINGTALNYPALISSAHDAGVKVLLSLGGAGNGANFSIVAVDSTLRSTFIQNLLDFILSRGYDGVDLDWEHPATLNQRDDLTRLVIDMRNLFAANAPELLITMAVPSTDWFGRWYDFNALEPHIDWFGCMTYDFFGSWVQRAGYNSPLYSPQTNNNGSVQFGVMYLNGRGIAKDKILAGIPFYGKMCNAGDYNQSYSGAVTDLLYNEIIPKLAQGWSYHWDDVAKVPYLLNSSNTGFITYDDTVSVRHKCMFARSESLAGVMIWALGQDKINGNMNLLEIVGQTMSISSGIVEQPEFQTWPADFKLEQNYPNPFNPITRLRYSMKMPGAVSLKIYNIRGAHVMTLLDHEIKAAGSYALDLNMADRSSGIYYAVLEKNSIKAVCKMVLMR
ncbi:T9SS type A sorting domain-containing protein [bacterium]|nr:T9SS type A sorting domain-containing protein [bacterium]